MSEVNKAYKPALAANYLSAATRWGGLAIALNK